MFCIQLIHRTGGSNSVHGETVEQCKTNAAARAGKDILVATTPYEIFLSPGWKNTYDATLPEDIRQGLGEEVLKLYLQGE